LIQIKQPELSQEHPEEDWISCISSFGSHISASLYSGSVSIYSKNKKIISQNVSLKSLKTIKLVEGTVFTGGLDGSIRIFSINKKSLENKFELEGGRSSIEQLDVNPLDQKFICAGGHDQKLYIWRTPEAKEHS